MGNEDLGRPLLKTLIRYEPDIVTARQKARRLAQHLQFDNQDQARLATAVSELARNVFQYVGQGTIEFFFAERSPQTLYVRVADAGPGIAAIDEILAGNYVSKSGMGVGLIGTKKLMDYFAVKTAAGEGTTVLIGKALTRSTRLISRAEIDEVIDKLFRQSAASPFEEIQNQNRDLMLALEEVRHAKEELASLNRELTETNRGVVALYAELDEKAASLQKANEVKTTFLSNITHEFRTPLSSIISLTRLLINRVDGDLSVEQEKQVNYIRKSGEGLLELVGDLLDLAKVEAGKVSVNSTGFPIEELLGGIRGMFRPIVGSQSAVDLGISLQGPAFTMNTDEAKVSQILRNLISNALKFTEVGTIAVVAELMPDESVQFTVADTGIGIAPEDREKIFAEFGQIESSLQSRQKGTGLGLPLSRKLARLLGGDLSLEGGTSVGSVFKVSLPRVYRGAGEGILFSPNGAARPPAGNEGTEIAEGSDHFRILLIDDQEPARYILKNLIAQELRAQFFEAEDGRDGLAQIRQQRPDLVTLDLSMPHMDGFAVLRELRADAALKGLPVIVNTARPLTNQEADYLAHETTAVLRKEEPNPDVTVRQLQLALHRAGFDYTKRASL